MSTDQETKRVSSSRRQTTRAAKKERRSRSVEMPRSKSAADGKHAPAQDSGEEKKRRSKSHRARRNRDASMNESSSRRRRHGESTSEEFTTEAASPNASMQDVFKNRKSNRTSRRSKEAEASISQSARMMSSRSARLHHGSASEGLDGSMKKSRSRQGGSYGGLLSSNHGDGPRASRAPKPTTTTGMDESSRRRHDRKSSRHNGAETVAGSAEEDEMNRSSRRDVHGRRERKHRRETRQHKSIRKAVSMPVPDAMPIKEGTSSKRRSPRRHTSPNPDAINDAISPERESKRGSVSKFQNSPEPAPSAVTKPNRIRTRRASVGTPQQRSRSPRRNTTYLPTRAKEAPERLQSLSHLDLRHNSSLQDLRNSQVIGDMIADSLEGQGSNNMLLKALDLRDFPMAAAAGEQEDVPDDGRRKIRFDKELFTVREIARLVDVWYTRQDLASMNIQSWDQDEKGPDGCWRGLEHVQTATGTAEKRKRIQKHVQSVKIKQITLNRKQKLDKSFDAAGELREFSRLNSKDDRRHAKIVAKEDASTVRRQERALQKRLAAEEEQKERAKLMSKLNPLAVVSATVESATHALVDARENTTKRVTDTFAEASTNATKLVAGATTSFLGVTTNATNIAGSIFGAKPAASGAATGTKRPKMFGPAPWPSARTAQT